MFILASASPRRRQLLGAAGFEFEVVPSEKEEPHGISRDPETLCTSLAKIKAEDVYSKCRKPTLGADTIVVSDGEVLGKPSSPEENASYLKRLSDRTHYVYTGFCLVADGKTYTGCVRSAVTFNKLSDDLIAEYVASGNGLDKAGGYGIQDGFPLVKSIKGSYTCVVGLPMEAVSALLKDVLKI